MKRRVFYIYRIECKISGKAYFGHAKNSVTNRWNKHCVDSMNGSKLALHCAIRKYGEGEFNVVVLGKCKTIHAVNRWEKLVITYWRKTKGHRYLYNMTNGGEGGGMLGKRHSFETRCLISKGNKGIQHTKQSRQNMSDGLKLKWKDPEYRKRRRVGLKRYFRRQRS